MNSPFDFDPMLYRRRFPEDFAVKLVTVQPINLSKEDCALIFAGKQLDKEDESCHS